MSEKILVPVLGESLNEATVSKWLKNKGDIVNADEAIVELETDKVNLEVPASISGVLSEVNSNEGDVVKVGSVLGVISGSKVKIDKTEKIEKTKPQNTEIQEKKENILNEEEPLILKEEIKTKEEKKEPTEKNLNLSPAVRKIISEKKIDINTIKGTGREGRILKGDLISLMAVSYTHLTLPTKRIV